MKIYLVVIIIGVALFSGLIVWARRDAAQDALNGVERKGNEMGDRSDKARSEYDRCDQLGGLYNYSTGRCKLPPKDSGY